MACAHNISNTRSSWVHSPFCDKLSANQKSVDWRSMKQAAQRENRLDVRKFLDEQPFGRYHLSIVAICASIVFMDGFDAQAMGYVAPALTASLKITRAALGPAISSGLFGMMIGALLFGPLADKLDRKSTRLNSSH